ncbi:hypothetical protein [Spirosoma foliorum]|nr:hypothetical protein [Spirosoma foliorum]
MNDKPKSGDFEQPWSGIVYLLVFAISSALMVLVGWGIVNYWIN